MDWLGYVREHGDNLTYIAFFGLLFLLMPVELWAPRRRGREQRLKRWPANFGLTVINILALGALPVTAVGSAILAEQGGWGVLNQIAAPAWAQIAATLLARSLVSYIVHVLMHKLPLFWRVHRVHHIDTEVDVSSTVRFHPFEFAIQAFPTAGVILALGLSPAAVLLYEIVDAVMAVATHANLRLPAVIDRIVKWVLVTPEMHRIHHSAWQPETDSNYGMLFTWWDRIFGTYTVAPAKGWEGMTVGLDDVQDRRAQNLLWLLLSPFRRQLALPATAAATGRPAATA